MSSEAVTVVPRFRLGRPPAHRRPARRASRTASLAIAAIAVLWGGCDRHEAQDRAGGSASSRPGAGGSDTGGALIAIIAEQDGVAAEIMEREVIAPIEAAVEARPGVRTVRSTIRDGRGVVIVELARGRELNAAFPALQTAVSGIRSLLPVGLPPPSIVLGDPDAPPLTWLAVSGPVTALELSELVREAIVPRLLRVAGVRDIELRGETRRAVIVRLDPARLDALGITVADVQTALGRVTSRRGARPGGGVPGSAPRDRATLGAVELARPGGAPIRLDEVAAIEDGIAPRPDPGDGPVMLGVRAQAGADPVLVVAALRGAIIELAAALPERCTLIEATPPASPQPQAQDDRRLPAITVSVRGPDWATLEQLADTLERELRAGPGLVSAVASDHRAGTPLQVISTDLVRAAGLGVSPSEISTTVRGLTVGPGKLHAASRDTPIVLRIGSPDLALREALDRARVRSAGGELVPLAAVATVETRPGVILTRRDRERAITLSVHPVVGLLRDAVRHRISELTRDLPAGYHATVTPRP